MRILPALLTVCALSAQTTLPTFDANAKVVLVPFNVERGKYFAADLQSSDFILREDGHPRPFTIFEGPHTAHPLPLELILLFDTTPLIPRKDNRLLSFRLDPKSDYEFLANWDEATTREALQRNGNDISMSVYHYSGNQLERLCSASRDPGEIVRAFHRLLNPIPPGTGEFSPLPGYTLNKQLLSIGPAGWMNESIVGTLKEAAASTVPARRLLLLFTRGDGGATVSKSLDPYTGLVEPSVAASIPINPVIVGLDKAHVIGSTPGMGGALSTVDPPPSLPQGLTSAAGATPGSWYGGLLPWIAKTGELTGGELFVPPHLNSGTLAAILTGVRDKALSQYVVGFTPDTAAKQKKHSLAVALELKSKGKVVGGQKYDVLY